MSADDKFGAVVMILNNFSMQLAYHKFMVIIVGVIFEYTLLTDILAHSALASFPPLNITT